MRRTAHTREAGTRPARGVTLLLVAVFALAICLAAGVLAPASAAAAPQAPYVGLTQVFFAFDWGNQKDIQVSAVARVVGQHCVLYVEQGRAVPESILENLASEFDTTVYPKVTAALGSGPDPGVDGESRVAVLLYGFNDAGLMGSFYYYDLLPVGSVDPPDSPTSNHREMFYLNLDAILAEPDRAAATAAHELAHLILYYRDFLLDVSPQRKYEGSVATWVEEGLAMYAELAAGYGDRAAIDLYSFQMSPDKNLTRWLGGYFSDYGASYAFITYLVDREGLDLAAQLVDQPADGIAGINAVLRSRRASETFAGLFDDWVVANYLDSRPPSEPPYAYTQIHMAADPLPLSGPLPVVGTGQVENYGAVYLDMPVLEEDSTATVHAVLDGDDGAPLHAALLSWDSTGLLPPTVTLLSLSPGAEGGTALSPPGYDRHTLAVWSRGSEGAAASYGFRYSLAVDPPGGGQFLDVGADNRFFTFIEDLQTRGIVSGKESPAGSGLWYFGPDEPVLRAQFAKMIVEATGLHTAEVDGTTTPTFKDVLPTFGVRGDPLPYPFDYVEEAGKAGIVGGYSDGRFGPWEPIKRIQLVRMILRGAAATGHAFPAYEGSDLVFADVPPGNPLYSDTMTAYENGIMSGAVGKDGNRYFDPWTSATRGQVAKMTFNLLQFLGL